ncbi:hypothetical protein B1J93_20330 [Leptospira kirschneri serovar Pomona]|uniref:Uncharacterized protein n=1 Tax=Leptospira kirschneri serovar Pomona TaxID=561005 RepID=A0A1T1DGF1_9LEPT|nr:hypothetical protein B1J93_20330 [Leptospira kirschneri serovar Pomona]
MQRLLCIRVLGEGGEVVGRFERFFFIRKSYFLQVKSMVLVGTLEKRTFLIQNLLSLWVELVISSGQTKIT